MGQQGPSPPPRATLYSRVSTADQSCERQERDLAAFTEHAGYEVVGTYKETASSVRADRVRCARWKRGGVAGCPEWDGVRPYDATRLTTPHGRMMATVLAGIAEFGRELTAERIRSGIAAAKARGNKLGRQHGQRSKSDRLTPKVPALVTQGRSYRFIGCEVGLSKNTVAGIVKRSRY